MNNPLVYLDMNIYNRPFDNQTLWRNRIETLACQIIFQLAQDQQLEIVWSFMLAYENSLNPFIERRQEIRLLSQLSRQVIEPSEGITRLVDPLIQCGIKNKDAIHLACAESVDCQFFITCDDKLTKKAKLLPLRVSVCNPIQFVQQVMNHEI